MNGCQRAADSSERILHKLSWIAFGSGRRNAAILVTLASDKAVVASFPCGLGRLLGAMRSRCLPLTPRPAPALLGHVHASGVPMLYTASPAQLKFSAEILRIILCNSWHHHLHRLLHRLARDGLAGQGP